MKNLLYITVLTIGVILASCQGYAVKFGVAKSKVEYITFDVANAKAELNAQCLAFNKSADRQIAGIDRKIAKLRTKSTVVSDASPADEIGTQKINDPGKEMAEALFVAAAR